MAAPEETRIISGRVPLALAQELERLAERNERTLSRELLIAVRRHVKVHRRRLVEDGAAQ